jgi:DNA polymerase I-like protein with 3'-5' exonuclease and polymerase domains
MPGFGASIPLDHFETKNYTSPGWDWKKMLRKFGEEVIENYDIVKVAWNWKFDDQINQKYRIFYRGTCLDGMLAKYLLNEEKPNDLKSMVRRYLPEYGNYEKQDAFDKIPWDQKELDPLCHYGCQDTDYTLRLMIFFEKKLIDLGLYSTFRNLIMSASRVLTSVEKNGLYLDREFNNQLLETYKPKIDAARQAIYDLPRVKKFEKKYNQEKIDKYIQSIESELEELDYNDPKDKRKIASREQKISNIKAGIFTTKKEQELIRPINLGSPIDLPALMYSERCFHFDVIKNNESGKPSTDEETLTNLRLTVKNPDSPKAVFLDSLLELRGLEKMYKTYIEGWHEKTQDDDRLHGRFLIHGCVTGDTKLVGKVRDIRIKDICPKEMGIKNIESQDLWVLTHEGTWEQITHAINKGKQITYKITTSEGDILKCTKEHKLLTTIGWKKVHEIFKKNLTVIMYDTSKFDIEAPNTGKPSKEVIFKEIPNWPGYLVSSEGKVFSVKIPGSRGLLDYNHPHELIPREWKLGRLRVYLRNNTNKKYAFPVSHLVWMTFNNQEIPEGMVIDHVNCNSLDNRPENLQCISYSENIKRSYKYTRISFVNGNRNGLTKFNTQVVGEILEKYQSGCTQKELVDLYGISQKQVSGITLKQRRKEIYIAKIISMECIGEKNIYDLSVNHNHSYITRSNFINSNTTSGRLSSAEPNAQQIPKTSVDPNIKKQLVAPKGTLYIASDFSQAELRIMAHLSGDETYLNAFNSGQDPHLAIAATKYHIPYEEALKIYEDENHPDHKIWKVRRKQAKQIAFGLIYGIGAKLLAVKLSDPKSGIIVTPEEAQKEMDIFFSQHPKLKTFLKKQEKFLRKNGYLVSLFGRKRRLPQIYSSDRGEEAYALRLALNFPCLLPSSQALSKTKGWVNYEDLKVGDEILAFNRDIGESEWQKVERVNVFDYDGDMIRLKTKHLDVLSTPDHRWVVTKPNKISKLDNTKVLTSEELYNSDKPYAIPIRAPHNNQVKARYSDAYVAFLGWYLTDGHLKNGNIVRICQSNTANPHKVDIIDSIMEELDVEFSRREKNQVIWEIRDPGFVYKLNRLVPERKLNMRLLTRLTNPQLSILLENMRLGDGWSVWATGDKTQGELLQALVVLCNNTSSMYELSHEGELSYFKDKKPSKYGQEFVRATKTSYGVKFSNFRKSVNTKNTYNSENNLTKEKYVGKVWCPTVKSGAFFTRVIGEDERYRTLITGNCQSAASDMCLFGSILIYYLMRQGKLPPTKSVCLVHDANYQITKPENINIWSIYEMWQIYRNPLTKPYFGFQIDDLDMEMDFVIGRSMAEELPFIPGYDYRKMLEPDFSVEEYMEEHKKYKHIKIKDYPKIFKKEIKKYKEGYEKKVH